MKWIFLVDSVSFKPFATFALSLSISLLEFIWHAIPSDIPFWRISMDDIYRISWLLKTSLQQQHREKQKKTNKNQKTQNQRHPEQMIQFPFRENYPAKLSPRFNVLVVELPVFKREPTKNNWFSPHTVQKG